VSPTYVFTGPHESATSASTLLGPLPRESVRSTSNGTTVRYTRDGTDRIIQRNVSTSGLGPANRAAVWPAGNNNGGGATILVLNKPTGTAAAPLAGHRRRIVDHDH
jgi:hypothetical protein